MADIAVSSTLVIHKHLDLMFPDDGSKYFNLDDHCPGEPLRHPDPSLMFRLLHLYEQNVHPLIKVVHMPCVRERFCDVSADPTTASAHDNALILAIYTIAVNTLTADECARLFGNTKRKIVWEEFRRNTQTALCRVELWRSSHINAIQAYLLYLLTLTKDVDPRALGICSGNVGRMVQRLLSLHNKRSTYGSVNVKEVNQEMGVRLWWEILACDMRACEKSGIASNPTLATPRRRRMVGRRTFMRIGPISRTARSCRCAARCSRRSWWRRGRSGRRRLRMGRSRVRLQRSRRSWLRCARLLRARGRRLRRLGDTRALIHGQRLTVLAEEAGSTASRWTDSGQEAQQTRLVLLPFWIRHWGRRRRRWRTC